MARPDQAQREFAAALADVPDNRLVCRGMQHAWDLERDYHTYTVKGSRALHLRRIWKCMRDCDVRCVEIFLVNKTRGRIERIARRVDYKHATGYEVKGVGRVAGRLAIVQQEMYKRAIAKASGALPGELDAPEA